MKAYGFLTILLVYGGVCAAQEKLGIVNSNYSSTNSIFLNPSSSSDSRTFMQLKFAGLNAFAMTNLGYLPKVSIWSYRAAGELPLPVVSETGLNRFVLVTMAAEGPCFVISKNNFGAGFHVRGRSVFNIKRMPHQLSSLILSQEPIGPNRSDLNVDNAGYNNLSWLEAGINFSYIIRKNAESMMQLGTNLNYLIGYNVIYGRVKSLIGTYNDSLMELSVANGRLVRSSPVFNSGKGYSADFGFTYKRMLSSVDNYMPHSQRSNCRYIDYKYKIGISLRDLGYIRFREGVSSKEFSGSGTLYIDQQRGDFTRIPLSSVQFDESTAPVRVLLPLTVSGQFDYNFENHVYVTAVVMKNLIPLSMLGAQGNELVSLIPRAEFKNIEVAMPFTLQRFLYPQIGFALRLRSFVVGVDNIFPVMVRTNVRHMGIYANLSVSLFKHPGCRQKTRTVDDCMPGAKIKGVKKPGLVKRVFNRNKTYSK